MDALRITQEHQICLAFQVPWLRFWSLDGITRMAKRKLKIGDKIRVVAYRCPEYPPGIADDMGTEELFKSMVGRCYTVKGFDRYGHVELQPKRLHTVWIEPDLIALV